MSATPPPDRAAVDGRAADAPPTPSRGPDAGSVAVPGSRATAPIRWPRPDRTGLLLAAVGVVGILIALGAPALVVAPNDMDAPTSRIGVAFGLTVLGAVILLIAGLAQAKRVKDTSPLLLAAVPAFTLVVGGVIIAANLLAASP